MCRDRNSPPPKLATQQPFFFFNFDVAGAAWPTNEAIVWELPHWLKGEQRYRLLSWESVTA